MRKVFTVLLCVLTFVALVSCNNEKDQTSSAVFSIGNNSRLAITEPVSAYTTSDNLTWLYSATAAEGSKFTYGATTCSKITLEDNYSSEEITLSNGKWSFKLWAVNTTTKDETNNTFNKTFTTDKGEEVKGIVVYEGSADDVLVNGFTSIPIDISNIIADSEATIVFNAVYIIPEGTTDKVAPNRVTLNGAEVNIVTDATDQEEGKYLLITDETLSGTLTIPAGKYEIVISYITTYEDGKSATNVSYPITRTIPTLTTLTLADDIAEETGSFKFNGIMTDGSVGNVYDNNTNKYYNLVEDESTGELKWENDNAPSTGTDTSLLLLDCSLSDDIPDSMINDTFETINFSGDFINNTLSYNEDGYNWTVYHPVNCKHTSDKAKAINEMYDGGYGTKLEPYGIASIDKWYNKYIYRSTYAYYKWAGPTTYTEDGKEQYVIDFDGFYQYGENLNGVFTWGRFYGSFDFNGAKVINRSINIFDQIVGDDSHTNVLKNLKFEADWYYHDNASIFSYWCTRSSTFKNIEVSGTLIGCYSAGSFLRNFGNNVAINFENCSSTADIVVLDSSNGPSGFISYGNSELSSIELNNSSYTGIMYKVNDDINCNYVLNDEATNPNIKETGSNNLGKLYNSSWEYLGSKIKFVYDDISSKVTLTTDPVSVEAAKNTETGNGDAATADFYVSIRVQTATGYYFACLKDKDVAPINGTFKSTNIHKYNVVKNGTDYTSSFAGNDFKVGGEPTRSYTTIIVVERNASKEIVKITRWFKVE